MLPKIEGKGWVALSLGIIDAICFFFYYYRIRQVGSNASYTIPQHQRFRNSRPNPGGIFIWLLLFVASTLNVSPSLMVLYLGRLSIL